VAAWPAIGLVGSYELFMTIIRGTRQPDPPVPGAGHGPEAVSGTDPLRGAGCRGVRRRRGGRSRSLNPGYLLAAARGANAHSRYARIWMHSLTGRSAESAQGPSCRAAQ
jgi:hypothetical protein